MSHNSHCQAVKSKELSVDLHNNKRVSSIIVRRHEDSFWSRPSSKTIQKASVLGDKQESNSHFDRASAVCGRDGRNIRPLWWRRLYGRNSLRALGQTFCVWWDIIKVFGQKSRHQTHFLLVPMVKHSGGSSRDKETDQRSLWSVWFRKDSDQIKVLNTWSFKVP